MAHSERTVDAVKTVSYFPARSAAEGTNLSTIWADNKITDEYQVLMPYLVDYYQVISGRAKVRTPMNRALQPRNFRLPVPVAQPNFSFSACRIHLYLHQLHLHQPLERLLHTAHHAEQRRQLHHTPGHRQPRPRWIQAYLWPVPPWPPCPSSSCSSSSQNTSLRESRWEQ